MERTENNVEDYEFFRKTPLRVALGIVLVVAIAWGIWELGALISARHQ